MKTLFLVRHATSFRNAEKFWGGGPGAIPLTDEGHAAAKAFAAGWDIRPDLIVTSPYARAVSTANPLAEKYSLPLITKDVQEFTYWDFSFTPDESEVDRKSQVAAFWTRLDPLEKEGGSQAESFAAFFLRCKALRRWAEQTRFETCVCFSHGFFMHAFRSLMQGDDLPPKEFMGYLNETLPGRAYANLAVAAYSFDRNQEIA